MAWPAHQTENYYEWQKSYHNGPFRWRRHPVLFDLFMSNPQAPEFYSDLVWEGRDPVRLYYPGIWQVQRWDSAKDDWGDVSTRIELPGMD